MRLIDVDTLMLKEFMVPPAGQYAILSHTWSTVASDEVVYADISKGGVRSCPDKPGKTKVVGCRQRAIRDGFRYVWIDSCCINKSDYSEVAEAINSMYRWYRESAVCYVYLEDVPDGAASALVPGGAFSKSRWFTRGWTLQELLAPHDMQFFNKTWGIISTKTEVLDNLETITGVPRQALIDFDPATTSISVAQRMSWAANRVTTREEDQSYCLLGLFNINLPMIYGEGGANAFLRLQRAVLEKTKDNSIFAWGLKSGAIPTTEQWLRRASRRSRAAIDKPVSAGIWAAQPSDFSQCGNLVRKSPVGDMEFSFTSTTMELNMHTVSPPPPAGPKNDRKSPDSPRTVSRSILTILSRTRKHESKTPSDDSENEVAQLSPGSLTYGLLNCGPGDPESDVVVGIPLFLVAAQGVGPHKQALYIRLMGFEPVLLDRPVAENGKPLEAPTIRIRIDTDPDIQPALREVLYELRFPRKLLALMETYPQSAWKGSSVRVPNDDDINGVESSNKKLVLARLRPVASPKATANEEDILFMARLYADDKGPRADLVLMTIHQGTPITGLVDRASLMRSSLYDHKQFTVNQEVISVRCDHFGHAFVIGPPANENLSGTAKVLAAEAEMQHVDNQKAILYHFSRQDTMYHAMAKEDAAYNRMLDTIQTDCKMSKLSFELAKRKRAEMKNDVLAEEQRASSLVKGVSVSQPPTEPRIWLSTLLLATHDSDGPCAECQEHCDRSDTETDPSTDISQAEDERRRGTAEQRAMFRCIVHGEIHAARELLRAGVDVNQTPENFLRPFLSMAVFLGDMAIVSTLVNYGHADVNIAERRSGETPLLVAIERSHEKIAGFLVKAGADVDASDTNGTTPLIRATHLGHVSGVRFLLHHGADLGSPDDKMTPLQLASSYGDDIIVRMLLDERTKRRSISDHELHGALFFAVDAGRPDIVQMLFTAKPKNLDAMNLVHMATYYNNASTLRTVLENTHVDFGVTVNYWSSADILMSVINKEAGECLDALLDHGFPTECSRRDSFYTPLAVAASYGSLAMVSKLLEHGANVEGTAIDDIYIPLYGAIKGGRINVVRKLLEYGADATAIAGSRSSLLKKAKSTGNTAIVKLLEDPNFSKKNPVKTRQAMEQELENKRIAERFRFSSQAKQMRSLREWRKEHRIST